jgi:hypothetical protein
MKMDLSHDLSYADTGSLTDALNVVGRLLEGYCSSLLASA